MHTQMVEYKNMVRWFVGGFYGWFFGYLVGGLECLMGYWQK